MTETTACCRGLAPPQECACAANDLDRLLRIEAAARELITDGLRLTPEGLIVVERADKSDPHYRLCKELGL